MIRAQVENAVLRQECRCAGGVSQGTEFSSNYGLSRQSFATASNYGCPMSPRLRSFLRYTGVNLATVSLDYAIFLTLTHTFGYPVLQSTFAYAIALAVNFYLTKKYVFQTDMSHKSETRLMAEFLGTGLLGLVLTAVVTAIGIDYLAMSPVWAKTLAVLICFVVLYIVRSRLVFSAAPTPIA